MVFGSFVFYLWWFSVSRRVIYLKPPEASERKEIRARGPNATFKTLPPVMQQLHHSQWCHRLGTKLSAHGPLETFMIQVLEGKRENIVLIPSLVFSGTNF